MYPRPDTFIYKLWNSNNNAPSTGKMFKIEVQAQDCSIYPIEQVDAFLKSSDYSMEQQPKSSG